MEDAIVHFKQKVMELNEELLCAICLSQFSDPVLLSPCAHVFCRNCVQVARKNECPTCWGQIEQTLEVKELKGVALKIKEVLRALVPLANVEGGKLP